MCGLMMLTINGDYLPMQHHPVDIDIENTVGFLVIWRTTSKNYFSGGGGGGEFFMFLKKK